MFSNNQINPLPLPQPPNNTSHTNNNADRDVFQPAVQTCDPTDSDLMDIVLPRESIQSQTSLVAPALNNNNNYHHYNNNSTNVINDLSYKRHSNPESVGAVLVGHHFHPYNNEAYDKEREQCLKVFERWNDADQVDFVQHVLHKMCHYQHGLIDSFLKPMLQRDFLSLLPKFYLDHLAEKILSYLDARSLASCEGVCKQWNRVVCQGALWKKLIERKVRNDPLWKGLSKRRGWNQHLYKAQNLNNALALLNSIKFNSTASNNGNVQNPNVNYPSISSGKDLIDLLQFNSNNNQNNPKNKSLAPLFFEYFNANLCHILPSLANYGPAAPSPGPLNSNSNNNNNSTAIRNSLSSQNNRHLQSPNVIVTANDGTTIIPTHSPYPLDGNVLIGQPTTTASNNHHNSSSSSLNSSIAAGNGMGGCHVFIDMNCLLASWFYKRLYALILADITNLQNNWKDGKHSLRRIKCRSENSKGVYCLQYDDHKIVSGLRDNTIKIWDYKTLDYLKVLTGHTGSVLCLQYDDKIIITGSSDATVRIWDVHTGEMLNTLIHHCEAVLHLRFEDGVMVTCSKDRSIAVWDMRSPKDISLRRVLVGHRAAVNVVDFDAKYIVSASGDRTIKVWDTSSCEFVRTLNGHKRGIACLQYRDRLIVSGSSDYTIRLWDIECGSCLRILEGHEELVRCIRFDNKRIVSGAYDGKIKVWDLGAALDPRIPAASVCIKTLVEHTGRVFRLQFDEFQIVSSSHDDSILIWDFLNYDAKEGEPLGGLSTLAVPMAEDEHHSLRAMTGGVTAQNTIPQPVSGPLSLSQNNSTTILLNSITNNPNPINLYTAVSLASATSSLTNASSIASTILAPRSQHSSNSNMVCDPGIPISSSEITAGQRTQVFDNEPNFMADFDDDEN